MNLNKVDGEGETVDPLFADCSRIRHESEQVKKDVHLEAAKFSAAIASARLFSEGALAQLRVMREGDFWFSRDRLAETHKAIQLP